jgi:hypothetical protein
MKKVIDGIDFVMHILPDTEEGYFYPRNVLVGSTHRPYEVWNRDDILMHYKAMSFEDCYINAYPNYDWMIQNGRLPPTFRPPPNYLMIDVDRTSFVNKTEFEQTIADTLSNIKTYITGITGEYPIVVDSGNGYHIHVAMPGITTSFENMPEFDAFWQQDLDLDNKFLRFLERVLSCGRADQHHNPSVNSCMFRMIGTINTKARDRGRKDPYVKVLEGYKHVNMRIAERFKATAYRQAHASGPTVKLLNDFYAFLIQERIDDTVDESDRRIRRMYQSLQPSSSSSTNGNMVVAWIEKILQIGVEDQRKDLLFWLLAPYLITVRGLDYDQAYTILVEDWLEKCNDVRRLYPGKSEFRARVKHCLKFCIERINGPKPRLPIRLQTFKEYYPDLYRQLFT